MKYILKLHIHQHYLLTRKVFFQHNFQHKSYSLYRLGHLVIFIFKSSLSSSHLLSHLLLQVFFITESASSRLLDHHCWIIITSGSSLDLDRHQVWIIITSGSSLDLDHHHMLSQNGAISILLITGSSIESSL